ncbi:MAG: matrixin family metalloprotease [Planctomycetes bacterium]|nr:matrixin family metalloprotease [Planctomycetota bacterium]
MKRIPLLLALLLALPLPLLANGGPTGKGRSLAHVVNLQQSGMSIGAPTFSGNSSTFVYHDGVTNVPSLSNVEAGSDPRTACNNGAAEWPAVSVVSFSDGGTTTTTTVANDGTNLITFANTAGNSSAVGGALAVTLTNYTTPSFTITDCDIVWSNAVTFSTLGTPTNYDIESIACHEFGHAFGLNHSGVCSATMFPFTGAGATHQRSLALDDVAGVNGVYQTIPNFWSTGVINGTITKSGTPLYGAHVVARSVADGVTYAAAMSKQDGTYSITGLPQGPYYVYAEPLDGPVGDTNITNGTYYPSGKDTSFQTTFLGGNATPTIVRVRETQVTASVDIAVTATAQTLNLRLIGDFPTGMGGFSASAGGYELAPGTTTFTVIGGPGVNTIADGAFSITGQGVSFTGASISSGTFGGGDGYKIFPTSVAADAEPGPRDIVVDIGSELTCYCGVIDVSPASSPMATTFAFGSSSTGTAGQPVLSSSGGAPTLPNSSFQLDVSNGVSGETCYFFAATKADYIDMGGGIVQWISIPNHDLFPSAGYNAPVVGGVASLASPIPNLPNLAGVHVYVQAALSDAGSMAGLSSTNCLVLVLYP